MTWFWLLLGVVAVVAYQGSRTQSVTEEPFFIPKRELLIVTLVVPGDQSPQIADFAADCLEAELDCQVEVLAKPLDLCKKAFDPKRGQGNAVTLVEQVEKLVTSERAVLGITEYDLHSPLRRDLPYAMGARKGWAGLISTFRMADKLKPENTVVRLQKMLVRYGAELVCDAAREPDPRSVLYENLQRPEQLDLMQWPPMEEGSS